MIETQIKQILPEETLNLFEEKSIDEEWAVKKLFDEYITSKEAHIDDPFMGCIRRFLRYRSENDLVVRGNERQNVKMLDSINYAKYF